MTERHYNGAIATYSGELFWPLDPLPGEVKIEDIARALSMICRFTGHVARFYSVAEHCIHVSRLVSPENALAGLLHDGSEAYIADVSSPVKRTEEFAGYRRIEARLQAVVYEAFGLGPETPDEVDEVDHALVHHEARALFREPPAWAEDPPLPGPPGIVGLPPGAAEVLYLERFKELTNER